MRFLYPNGKKQALTFSFDDNQSFDRELISIFNKYNVKGTFNINTSTLDKGAETNCDGNIYINTAEINSLYKGHEIAAHGHFHKYLPGLTDTMILEEFLSNRKILENITGKLVQGSAYAYGVSDSHIRELMKSMGFKYARGVTSTGNFFPPVDFMDWTPTCHQADPNLMNYCETFLNVPGYIDLPLMYVWGHSFEFGRNNNDYSSIEKFCSKISGKDFIWYATNIEICNYILATKNLEFNAECTMVFNPGVIKIWIEKDDGKLITVDSGQTVSIL